MGFTDLISDAGLTLLNNWTKTRSYVVGYVATPPPRLLLRVCALS
jgi:hypothetical protein